MKMTYAAGALAAVLLAGSALTGCNRDSQMPILGSSTPHFKIPPKKGPTVEEQTAGMAAAPTLGRSTLPVELKFALADRPQIGKPVEISLALLPQVQGGPASIQLADSAGIDASQGDAPFNVPEVLPGEVYRHSVHVTPNGDGVLLVNLTVTLKHDDMDDSKVFSVPVVVDR